MIPSFIEPKEIEIDERRFIISKIPAMPGIEVVTKASIAFSAFTSNSFKLSDYKDFEDVMIKIFSYAAIIAANDKPVQLSAKSVIDGNIPSWETACKLLGQMVEYNVSFFQGGLVSNYLKELTQKLNSSSTKITTPSSQS